MARRHRFTVSLAMIVRDEEKQLPSSLASVRGLFDELVVVDTGSQDATRQVARSFGAAVFEFDWCDDFSEARNAAGDHCSCDYVFWMDADETVPPRERPKLARVLSEIANNQSVYAVTETSHRVDGAIGLSVAPSVRLVPRRAGSRWARRVYERILPPPDLPWQRPTLVPVEVAHHGFADWNVVIRKLERNKRLVEIELERDSGDPVALYNLASTHFMFGHALASRDHYVLADNYIRLAVEKSENRGGVADRTAAPAEAYSLLCRTLLVLLSYSDAIATCSRARVAYPQDLGLLCCEAAVLAECGMWAEARTRWQALPSLKNYRNSVGMGLGHYAKLLAAKAEYAYFLEENGRWYEAAGVWTDLARNCPASFDAVAGVRRALRRILPDALRRPGSFLKNLNRAFALSTEAK